MSEFKIVVMTCNKYLWAIRPFAYLFNLYWSQEQEVTVCGYTPPKFEMPKNFSFLSISDDEYPANKWSNGLLHVLRSLKDDHVIIMLEDYWLCRPADIRGVRAGLETMQGDDTIIRFDLTADRLYAGGMRDYGYCGSYDLVITPHTTPYQMSLQAAIWNRKRLLELLVPNKSPWEVEIHTTIPAELKVLGTRQWPVRYANAFNSGDSNKVLNLDQINPVHVTTMKMMGMLK